MNDAFTPNAFKITTLTAAINKIPFQPTRIGDMGIFTASGINTLDCAIEESNGTLQLVEVKPRNAPGKQISDAPRKVRTFRVPHLPESSSVMADEVQGVRAFGSDGSQTEVLQVRINERLADMRRNLDYTLEQHRVAAIMGNFYDANGGTTSLFTEFAVAQQTQAMNLHKTNTSYFREQLFNVRKKVRVGLGGIPGSDGSLRVLCGDAFWAALLEDKDIKSTFLNQQQAAELRGTVTDSVRIGSATFEWYEGTAEVNLGSDAYVIPESVPGLFITRYAPANYAETVNSIGLPFYAKGAPMKFNKGWEMEAQSNPLNLCTRPAAIVKLTIA